MLAFSRVPFGLFYTDHAAGEWLGALRKALAGCISFVGGGADIRATAGTGVSFANTGASGQGTQISIDAICISGNGPTLCGVDGKTLLWNADLGLGAGVAGTGCSSGTSGANTASTANICAAASTAVPSANTKSLYIPRILGFAKKFPSTGSKKTARFFPARNI